MCRKFKLALGLLLTKYVGRPDTGNNQAPYPAVKEGSKLLNMFMKTTKHATCSKRLLRMIFFLNFSQKKLAILTSVVS